MGNYLDNLFFSGDTHFGHANILRYCNRPFEGIREHDEALIANWNSVIKPDDHVYHLGDFAMSCSKGYAIQILQRLNGKIFILRGNHDKLLNKPEVASYFQWVKDYYELPIQDPEMNGKHKIVLCHYAFEVWNKSHWNSWMLHGHSHNTLATPNHMARYDVGVDGNNYTPVSYQQIKEIMTRKVFRKVFRPVDGHQGKKGK